MTRALLLGAILLLTGGGTEAPCPHASQTGLSWETVSCSRDDGTTGEKRCSYTECRECHRRIGWTCGACR